MARESLPKAAGCGALSSEKQREQPFLPPRWGSYGGEGHQGSPSSLAASAVAWDRPVFLSATPGLQLPVPGGIGVSPSTTCPANSCSPVLLRDPRTSHPSVCMSP